MVRLKEINGATHFAQYDFTDGRWKRAQVYRLEGRSDNSLIVYFRSLDGRWEHKRGAAYLHTDSFRPFAINGGRK